MADRGLQSDDIKSKLAGFLGYLDFELNSSTGALKRDGLKPIAKPADKSIQIIIKASAEAKIVVMANGNQLGSSEIKGEGFQEVSIALQGNSSWQGLFSQSV